ncbi:hypothetical protein DPMN_182701 [Dreissena polymorpha]|uniref:Uncharacterized protein n=1 Tax=Dreissena polymorpha TaxID=45954 RepID=A0A9D4DFZ7_DREPO|nr:hypothetical protein DPMN_182701 [Dreissena polymorpha]
MIWGLWPGKGKPNFKTCLQPLVDELIKLQEGVIVGQHQGHIDMLHNGTAS